MIDLLEQVEIDSCFYKSKDKQELLSNISEANQLMMSLYECERLLVEQNTYITMELECGIINEGAMSKIWEAVKNIFKRILNLLTNFKNWLVKSYKKFEDLQNKIFEASNQRTISNVAKKAYSNASKKGKTVTQIEITDWALVFIRNYKPLKQCQLMNTIVDASEEVSKFIGNSSTALSDDNANNNKSIMDKCPSFNKMYEMTKDDKDIMVSIMKELSLPYDRSGSNSENNKVENYIKIGEKIDPNDFYSKYFKNCQEAADLFNKTVKYNTSDVDQFTSRISSQVNYMSKIKNPDSLYGNIAQGFMKMNTALIRALTYRTSMYMRLYNALLLYNNEFLLCYKA